MKGIMGLRYSESGVFEVRTRERESICDFHELSQNDARIATRFIDSLGYAAELALGVDPKQQEFWKTPCLSSEKPPCGRVVMSILIQLQNELSRDRSGKGKGKEQAEDPH